MIFRNLEENFREGNNLIKIVVSSCFLLVGIRFRKVWVGDYCYLLLVS